MIIALVFTPTLVTKMHGMYKLNVGSYALATVARALVAVAGYTGSGDVKMMLLFTAIAALGQGPWQGDMNAVIASCSEYTWLTKHKRVDGTMYFLHLARCQDGRRPRHRHHRLAAGVQQL